MRSVSRRQEKPWLERDQERVSVDERLSYSVDLSRPFIYTASVLDRVQIMTDA